MQDEDDAEFAQRTGTRRAKVTGFHSRREDGGGHRPRIYETPEEFWDACLDYFEWVHENPLYEAKVVTYQGDTELVSVPKRRVMTNLGLCLHLGFSLSTLTHYHRREEFKDVVERALEIIEADKFEGASSDLYNASFMGKALGLQDRHEIDHRSGDGSMSPRPLSDFYAGADGDGEEGGD